MSALRKNVASQVVTFCLVNATTGAALTGATVTVKVTLDGTQSAGAGTVTELGTGQYKYAPTQGETNGTSVGLLFTATNAVPVNLHCFTTNQDPTAASVTISAASIQAIWDALTSALTTSGSIGKRIVDYLTGDAFARLGAPVGASISADIAGVPAAALDLSNGIETSITLRQAVRLLLAASAGKLSGAATTTIVIRNVGDTKDRITATVDANGNRTAVTTDVS